MDDRRQSWSGSDHENSAAFNSPLSSPSLAGSNSSTPQSLLQGVPYSADRTPFDPYTSGDVSVTQFTATVMNEVEEDGDSDERSSVSKKDIHTINEQRRRDIIKQSYATLEKIVPTCKPNPGSTRLSRATVLLKTCDYMSHLEEQKKKQSVKLQSLRKEVKALEIMKENYEQMVRAQSQQVGHQPGSSSSTISNDLKMKLFHSLMECLFQSFDSQVSVDNFDRLSSCVISWLEDSCSPQKFQALVSSQMKSLGLLSPPFPHPSHHYHHHH